MHVAAIVPAFNEEQRIGKVLDVLQATSELHEIIVVDDGSIDNTSQVAQERTGIQVIRLKQNAGKGAALLHGAHAAHAEILVFLDADLVGLDPDHVRSLITPILEHKTDMSVALFHGGRWRTDMAQRMVPCISGQRALYKHFFLSIPNIESTRYSLETALTMEACLRGLRIQRIRWENVTHVLKEEKVGLIRGTWERMRMYLQILAYLWSARWQKRNRREAALSWKRETGEK